MKTNIPKNNPFKAPESYLANFQDNLLAQIGKNESGLPHKEGFSVPEGYFDTVHQQIVERLDNETKVVPISTFTKYVFRVASIAAVIVVCMILYWPTKKELRFSDLANSEIEAYFENNDLFRSSYEISDELAISDFAASDFMENTIQHELIYNYLNENIEDFETLTIVSDE